MAQREVEIGRPTGAVRLDARGSSGCQSRRGHDSLAVLAAKGFHRGMVPLMQLALRICFRRVRVLHAERVPRQGAVLLVANHPSTWTDVLLLDAVLGRRFHFLAHGEQFHPWPRKILLDLYGTLPLWSQERTAGARARNEATFLRCEALFDRAEGVAVFPEGISRVDRGMLPLKHGAARLALSYASRHDAQRPFALVPIGIYYSDRTAFRSEVTVSVGKAVPIPAQPAFEGSDAEEEARRLTERMAEEMHALVLQELDHSLAGTFAELDPLAADGNESLDFEAARVLAKLLADERRDHPLELARFARRCRRFGRMRAALGVSGAALAPRSRANRARDWLALAAGAIPALAGVAIHAFPATLTHVATQRYVGEPSRVAFARIASGLLFLTLFYGAGIAFLLFRTPVHPVWVLALVPVSVLLGLFSYEYARRLRLECERSRVAWLARCHGRFVRRALLERETLLAHVADVRS